jgi:hypothetical protein
MHAFLILTASISKRKTISLPLLSCQSRRFLIGFARPKVFTCKSVCLHSPSDLRGPQSPQRSPWSDLEISHSVAPPLPRPTFAMKSPWVSPSGRDITNNFLCNGDALDTSNSRVQLLSPRPHTLSLLSYLHSQTDRPARRCVGAGYGSLMCRSHVAGSA